MTADDLDRLADVFARHALNETNPDVAKDWQLCCAIARCEADRRRERPT